MKKENKAPAGRPPKCIIRKVDDRKGILPEPFDANNIFEMTHNNPNMFKSVFEGSKKVDDVMKCIFTPAGVKFIFENKANFCNELIEIDGSRLVGYYCDKVYYYTCITTTLNTLIGLKKCDFEHIRFYINKNNLYNMYLCFLMGYKPDGSADIEESYDISLDRCEQIDYQPYVDRFAMIPEYPLSFTYKWAFFKESVNSWKKLEPKNIVFSKDSESPFNATFQEGTNHAQRINKEEIIKLRYTSDQIVAVQISLSSLLCIAPFSDIATHITVYLSNDMAHESIMYAELDEAYITKKEKIPNTATTTIKYFIPKN